VWKFLNSPIVILLLGALLIAAIVVGPYYLMSPYQNCLRSANPNYTEIYKHEYCRKQTSW